jgi:hypothetical protein
MEGIQQVTDGDVDVKMTLNGAQEEVRECSICTSTLPESSFPGKTMSQACTHRQSYCCACIQRHLSTQIEEQQWDHITCIMCPVLLTHQDVKDHALPEFFVQ